MQYRDKKIQIQSTKVLLKIYKFFQKFTKKVSICNNKTNTQKKTDSFKYLEIFQMTFLTI